MSRKSKEERRQRELEAKRAAERQRRENEAYWAARKRREAGHSGGMQPGPSYHWVNPNRKKEDSPGAS